MSESHPVIVILLVSLRQSHLVIGILLEWHYVRESYCYCNSVCVILQNGILPNVILPNGILPNVIFVLIHVISLADCLCSVILPSLRSRF
jgi:hypothetical protein